MAVSTKSPKPESDEELGFSPAEIQALQKEYEKRSAESFDAFRRGLMIGTARGAKMYELIAADFQEETFADLSPNVTALRDGEMPEKRRFWIERTKKASKDADLGIVVLWLMAFPVRPFYCQIGAADTEQAGIVKDRISVLLHHNEWLNEHVEIVQSEIRSKVMLANGKPMAHAKIMSSDVSGAHGGTPDLLVMNELSHIKSWEFAENMMSNAAGVPTGIAIVATNAGLKGTGAWQWRENALASERWSCHILAEPAPWHSAEDVEDEKKLNPPSKFRRLWRGVWSSGTGDAVSEEDLDKAFPANCRGPMSGPQKGWTCIAGLDLGVSRDHAGLVILGINEMERRLRTFEWVRWIPPKGGEIDLMAVEEATVHLCRKFDVFRLLYDPHQAKLMAQRLQSRHVDCIEYTFSSTKNMVDMAMCFLEAIENNILECYDDPDGTLRGDFAKFKIIETKYGFRLDAVRDATGHADVGTALVVALPTAIEFLKAPMGLMGDFVAEVDEDELSDEELDALPEEFKEIFQTEDELSEEKDSFSSDFDVDLWFGE